MHVRARVCLRESETEGGQTTHRAIMWKHVEFYCPLATTYRNRACKIRTMAMWQCVCEWVLKMQSRITDRDLALIVNFLYITAKGKRDAVWVDVSAIQHQRDDRQWKWFVKCNMFSTLVSSFPASFLSFCAAAINSFWPRGKNKSGRTRQVEPQMAKFSPFFINGTRKGNTKMWCETMQIYTLYFLTEHMNRDAM